MKQSGLKDSLRPKGLIKIQKQTATILKSSTPSDVHPDEKTDTKLFPLDNPLYLTG